MISFLYKYQWLFLVNCQWLLLLSYFFSKWCEVKRIYPHSPSQLHPAHGKTWLFRIKNKVGLNLHSIENTLTSWLLCTNLSLPAMIIGHWQSRASNHVHQSIISANFVLILKVPPLVWFWRMQGLHFLWQPPREFPTLKDGLFNLSRQVIVKNGEAHRVTTTCHLLLV
jgi:hypothetical protein